MRICALSIMVFELFLNNVNIFNNVKGRVAQIEK